MPERDLGTVLSGLRYPDDARVVEQLSDQASRVRQRLAPIRRRLFIMSGKGGVGKSATTAQLALALARRGLRVGILDADLNGPSVPRMLGLLGKKWRFGAVGAEPEIGPHGIRVASAAFFLEENEPFRWRGPKDLTPVWLGMLESGTLRELLGDVNWGELDILLFDLPPGAASDKPPALLQLVGELGGAVFVTTPSAVARSVVERSQAYARDLGIRNLGSIENMSGYRCPACCAVGPLFAGNGFPPGADPGSELLGRIPFDPELSASLDSGKPLPVGHPTTLLFDAIALRVLGRLDESPGGAP